MLRAYFNQIPKANLSILRSTDNVCISVWYTTVQLVWTAQVSFITVKTFTQLDWLTYIMLSTIQKIVLCICVYACVSVFICLSVSMCDAYMKFCTCLTSLHCPCLVTVTCCPVWTPAHSDHREKNWHMSQDLCANNDTLHCSATTM